MKYLFSAFFIFKIVFFYAFSGIYGQEISMSELKLKTKSYNMDISIDYDRETMRNICGIVFFNPSNDPISNIPLTLYRQLEVKSVKDKNNKEVSYRQSLQAFTDQKRKHINFVEITLDNPIPPEGELSLTLDIEGFLTGMSEVYGYVHDKIDPDFTIIRNDSESFPKLGYPSRAINLPSILGQRFDYRVKVTVPDSLVVANGGTLVDRIYNNGKVTFIYESIRPSWRIDIAISNYQMFEKGKNKIFCFPEDKRNADIILNSLSNTLDLYTDWFGPLRDYSGLTVIEIPDGWGSQSDVTTIIQTAAAFKDIKNLYEFYHELSHQWNVMFNDPPSPRIEEGLACFLQFLTAETLENRKVLDSSMNRYLNYINNSLFRNAEYVGIPMKDYGIQNATRLSYTVGAVFFYLIYDIVGHDEFCSVLGSFYQEYYDKKVTTDGFIEYMTENFTKDITKVVNDWYTGIVYVKHIQSGINVDDLKVIYRK